MKLDRELQGNKMEDLKRVHIILFNTGVQRGSTFILLSNIKICLKPFLRRKEKKRKGKKR